MYFNFERYCSVIRSDTYTEPYFDICMLHYANIGYVKPSGEKYCSINEIQFSHIKNIVLIFVLPLVGILSRIIVCRVNFFPLNVRRSLPGFLYPI